MFMDGRNRNRDPLAESVGPSGFQALVASNAVVKGPMRAGVIVRGEWRDDPILGIHVHHFHPLLKREPETVLVVGPAFDIGQAE